MEDEGTAAAAGRPGLMEVCGWGSVSSAFHMTALRTTGQDITRAILQALADAGLSPELIDCVDAHGTSTPFNDAAEAAAFQEVFGPRAHRIPVVAQKGVTGHALGAANLLEVVGAVGYTRLGLLPPTANTVKETLDVPLDLVLETPRPHSPRYVLKTSSGFSGLHSACVLRVLP
ncbi:hypothetical protein [Streptomyces sp. NPDC088755]|uniref:hypothetical protein n=1 Tax=Streptomyces sp. NPDC088755 TaxID=3365888 RepID=UPI003826A750